MKNVIVDLGNMEIKFSGDKTDQKQLFFRSHGKQSISEARKHAAYRSL